MANIFTGNYNLEDVQIGIVVSRFNEFITSKLLSGCIDTLIRHGVLDDDIDVAWTPGAFEIPFIAQELASKNQHDAIICLGAVIRGSTPHFDYVAGEVSKGVASVGLNQKIPVIFGVLTTDTIEQAIERAGTKSGNKGSEAALSALEMISLKKAISTNKPSSTHLVKQAFSP